MTGPGIKQLTFENWLAPDDAVFCCAGMECVKDYVADVLTPKLSEKVPKDIHRLFEVARGTVLYGYLYYPLFTVGIEQLFRVGEAAIAHKCAQLAAPGSREHFNDRIGWLVENGALSPEEVNAWHALRRLRNSASHRTRQSIFTPGMAIMTLYQLARDVNALFDKVGVHGSKGE